MAKFVQSYKAKGVLSVSDMELTEIKKEGTFIHELEEALKRFDGYEVTISITTEEEVEPKEVEGVLG